MSMTNQGPEGMILGGRYRIARLIGSGGMANVYLASDMTSGIQVAIKILKPEFSADTEFIKRFDAEARSASKLTHPNIVRVLGVGQEGEFRYMVQEYVDGITVKELISQNGHLDWRVAVPIAIQVGMALENAHLNGIVHRDIKPHNILITRDRIAKVADFGIARAASSNTITLTSGGALGSVHYFSPEQARGSIVGPSTDIYSFGILLFEMITGRLPFDGDTSVAIAIKHLQEPPPLASSFIPSLPAGLDAIVQKCMQKSVDYRYMSIHDVVAELDALMVDPNGAYGIITRSETVDASTSQIQSMRHDPNYNKLRDIEHSIEKRRRSRTKDNVLVILLVTLIIGILLGAVYLVVSVVTKNISGNVKDSYTVVNYIGQPIVDVEKVLKAAGVQYEITTRISEEYQPGIIIEQSLKPGVVIKPQNGLHTLELVISASQQSITLTDFSGMDQQAAIDELTARGLLFSVRMEDSNSVDKNMVIRTEPSAGSLVMPGDTITIFVSQGVSTVTVPNLKGQTLVTAKETILKSLLNLGTVTVYESAKDKPEVEQIVLSSDPAEGQLVSPKSGINLVVGTIDDFINSSYGITPTPTPASYLLYINQAEGGLATGAGSFVEKKKVTVIATPSEGYRLLRWIDDTGAEIGNTESLSFVMPSRNYTIQPIFEKTVFKVTLLEPNIKDAMQSSSGSGEYKSGDSVTISAVAKNGFEFVRWEDESGDVIKDAGSSYTFTMPARDIKYRPVFKASPTPTPSSFQLTVKSTEGGRVEGSESKAYPQGTNIALTAKPDNGYHFSHWVDGSGDKIGDNASLEFKMPGKDYTVSAVFKQSSFEVKIASPDDQAAQKSVSGAGSYAFGSSVTVKVVPNDGYVFKMWTDANGKKIENAAAEYTFTMPANEVTLKPVFEKKPKNTNTDSSADISALTAMNTVYAFPISISDQITMISYTNRS